MPFVRAAAVAGRFYPADCETLRNDVRRFVSSGREVGLVPKAIIVPHAGYVYSGPVAGSGYAQLRDLRNRIRRVVLIGPAHRVPFAGIACCTADAFETPLGRVPVDKDAVSEVLALPQVHAIDAAHEDEHSLEVHLPFLQETLSDFKLVPLVVGTATAAEVREVIERLWGGAETLIVVSSDLSHYHDYVTAGRIDAETSQAIAELRTGDLCAEMACGFLAVGGLLEAAKTRGLQARIVDVRNSGDTAGSHDQVVGYGAYVIG